MERYSILVQPLLEKISQLVNVAVGFLAVIIPVIFIVYGVINIINIAVKGVYVLASEQKSSAIETFEIEQKAREEEVYYQEGWNNKEIDDDYVESWFQEAKPAKGFDDVDEDLLSDYEKSPEFLMDLLGVK